MFIIIFVAVNKMRRQLCHVRKRLAIYRKGRHIANRTDRLIGIAAYIVIKKAVCTSELTGAALDSCVFCYLFSLCNIFTIELNMIVAVFILFL